MEALRELPLWKDVKLGQACVRRAEVYNRMRRAVKEGLQSLVFLGQRWR